MNVSFRELAVVAKEYCALIESSDESSKLLEKLSSVLPQLHVAVAKLGTPGEFPEYMVEADLEIRFESFYRLHSLLGELDAYWLQYDVTPDGQNKTGSLADDLTDIYCELKHTLFLIDDAKKDPKQVLDDLCHSFQVHWGQHLVDAERYIYELKAMDVR